MCQVRSTMQTKTKLLDSKYTIFYLSGLNNFYWVSHNHLFIVLDKNVINKIYYYYSNHYDYMQISFTYYCF
jgi:hypothetical protein